MTTTSSSPTRPGAIALRDILARREADRIVLFHTDHFEPWQSGPKKNRLDRRRRRIDWLHDFAERMAQLAHARRLGLFYRPDMSVAATAAGMIAAEGDPVGFVPRPDDEEAMVRAGFAALPTGFDPDWQVHVHHESWTWNKRTGIDHPLRHLISESDPARERRRFKLGLSEALRRVRADTGRPLHRWFFVHGLWALNASDADVCSMTHEIEDLRAAGCLGDFTFPAGREHCDPPFDQPSAVRPVDAIKGYATPQADPVAPQAISDERFFIWSSRVSSQDASLDFYSDGVAANFADPEPWAERLLMNSIQRGRTIYVKTHAHSLMSFYTDERSGRAGGQFPHEHEGVRRLMSLLEGAAASAGGTLEYLWPSEVYDEVRSPAEPAERWGFADAGLLFPRVALEQAEAATLAVLVERLGRLGEADGGLGSHYEMLVRRGRIIVAFETEILNLVNRLVPPDMPIVAPRSALSPVPFALAAAGRNVLSVEAGGARHEAQQEIAAALSVGQPQIRDRLRLRRAGPADVGLDDVRGSCLLFTDAVTKLSEAQERRLHELFAAAAMVIVDAGRFGARRNTADATAFGTALRGAGGTRATRILNLGEDAQVYLIDNRATQTPRRAPGLLRRLLGRPARG